MTYPCHRNNLHGIMYLPWNRRAAKAKKITRVSFRG